MNWNSTPPNRYLVAGTEVTIIRRRFKQIQFLEERLAEEAKRLQEEAQLLPPGAQRDAVERKARQAETSAHISDWLRLPGVQPPR